MIRVAVIGIGGYGWGLISKIEAAAPSRAVHTDPYDLTNYTEFPQHFTMD